MKNTLIVIAIAALTVIGMVLWNRSSETRTNELKSLISDKAIVVASATCGCCRLYSQYLGQQGFDVDLQLKSQEETDRYKDENGIPFSVRSCHTSRIGNYLVEGHVPVEAIIKLLKEKPAIKGIGMAGMPSASPGMPGAKEGPFIIRTITNDGRDGGLFMQL